MSTRSQRWIGTERGGLLPLASGDLVKFADVEEALQDKDRLEWLFPALAGKHGDPVGNSRTAALTAGLQIGLTGRALVDWAREGSL